MSSLVKKRLRALRERVAVHTEGHGLAKFQAWLAALSHEQIMRIWENLKRLRAVGREEPETWEGILERCQLAKDEAWVTAEIERARRP